jgi:hypothetical protein
MPSFSRGDSFRYEGTKCVLRVLLARRVVYERQFSRRVTEGRTLSRPPSCSYVTTFEASRCAKSLLFAEIGKRERSK